MHGTGAIVFFFAYAAYMLFATVDEFARNGCSLCHRGLALMPLLAGSIVAKLRFGCVRGCLARHVPRWADALSAEGSIAAHDVPFEWADIACITLFLAATVFLRPQGAGKRFAVAIVKSS